MTLNLFPETDLHAQGVKSALSALRDKASTCKKCPLHQGRTTTVFGEGNVYSPSVCFVGEGPGKNEDEQGRPFIGRAGKLLDNIIESMGLTRESSYICNVVCCRPPNNRKPEKEEVEACDLFLSGQIRLIQPKLIVALGATAARAVTNSTKSIGDLRGRWLEWKDKKKGSPTFGERIMVRATYHPAYLLRNPAAKKEVWKDMKVVRAWLDRDA